MFKEIFAIMDNGSDRLVDEAQAAFYDAWMDWQDSESNEREEVEDDYYEDQTLVISPPEKTLEVLMNFV